MIDCGTKNLEKEGYSDVIEHLRSRDVLAADWISFNEIEALVLTHSDKDHYNRITEILEGLTVKKVYFSEPALTDPARRDAYLKGPLQSYHEGSANLTIYEDLKVEELCCVTTRASAKQIKVDKWTPPFQEKQHKEVIFKYANPSKTLLEIVTVPKYDFSVSILAGNVSKEPGDKSADEHNPASLVTLVKMGDIRILICGDATSSTEMYLLNYHSDKLKDLKLLQVPHHGSTTSSTAAFINLTKPKEIIISVKQDEHTHNLPRGEIVKSYENSGYLESIDDAWNISYWNRSTKSELIKRKASWMKTPGLIEQSTKNKNLFVRKEPDRDGVKILDGIKKVSTSTAFYMLYELLTLKKIKQTGMHGHCWFLYPE